MSTINRQTAQREKHAFCCKGRKMLSFSFKATPLNPLSIIDEAFHRATDSSWVVRSRVADPSAAEGCSICTAALSFHPTRRGASKTLESQVFKSTHQTSSDVVDGLPGVHTRPVVQHVADTGCAVDEPNIVFASLGQRVKTGNNKMSRHKKRCEDRRAA